MNALSWVLSGRAGNSTRMASNHTENVVIGVLVILGLLVFDLAYWHVRRGGAVRGSKRDE